MVEVLGEGMNPQYAGEVRVVRSSYTSKNGPTITLALHDIDELGKVASLDGKRFMVALVQIGDDEQPVEAPELKGGELAKLAGRWCSDPEFWEWLNQFHSGDLVDSEKRAAELVRDICNISSRARLDHDKFAAARFNDLIREPYRAWLEAA